VKPVALLAVVALLQDHPESNLTRGQIGTVVEHLDRDGEQAVLVEFSDDQGQTYAMIAFPADQLMVLHKTIEAA